MHLPLRCHTADDEDDEDDEDDFVNFEEPSHREESAVIAAPSFIKSL